MVRPGDTVAQKQRSGENDPKYAEVWEIWSATTRERIFVAKGGGDVLERKRDPLGLSTFYPCPRPAFSSLTNEDLFPTPDYKQYIRLAEELDTITYRIRKLVEVLRLVGVYDASAEGLGKLLQATKDGEMIPVSNFAALIAKSSTAGGGMNGVVAWLPMSETINTLIGLYQSRDQAKQTLYEVSGLSDIVRGQVDPREKLGQSQMKAQFTSQRLDQRRRAVERTARDVCRIMVEIMAELFTPMTLREQSGFDYMQEVQQAESEQPGVGDLLWQQVEELIGNEKARGFRIDIETDSTVEMDSGQTKQERNEFLQSAGSFLGNALPYRAGRAAVRAGDWRDAAVRRAVVSRRPRA